MTSFLCATFNVLVIDTPIEVVLSFPLNFAKKSLGKELAMTSVRVNSVAPAAVSTSLLAQINPEHVQVIVDKSPMQGFG